MRVGPAASAIDPSPSFYLHNQNITEIESINFRQGKSGQPMPRFQTGLSVFFVVFARTIIDLEHFFFILDAEPQKNFIIMHFVLTSSKCRSPRRAIATCSCLRSYRCCQAGEYRAKHFSESYSSQKIGENHFSCFWSYLFFFGTASVTLRFIIFFLVPSKRDFRELRKHEILSAIERTQLWGFCIAL